MFGILLHVAKMDDAIVHNNELNFPERPLTKIAKNTKIVKLERTLTR